MLLAIRDRMTGAVLWVIVGLIIITFALFGIQSYIGVGNEPVAIKFNDSEVTMREFERRLQINRQQLAQRFGGTLPEMFDNSDLLRQQTITQIIDREALVQYVNENSYGSSGEEIYRNIAALPQFQLDGKFSPDVYERSVNSRGYSKQAFEYQVGLDIAIGQLQQGIVASALVLNPQLKAYVSLTKQRRDFTHLTLDIDNYKKKINLSDIDLQNYYDANKSSFMTEQQVALQYLELKTADMATDIVVDDATLQDLYDNNAIPGIADKPETRKASHILVLVDEAASPEEINAGEEKINAIRTRALNEDFATLAKEVSEDAGSAPSGGDLGNVARGVMVKPFEDALFDMQENTISDVIKTQFGFHIIKLIKIHAAEKPAFAKVKSKIEAAYKEQEAEKLYYETADQLANLAFEQPDSLDAAAEELGLTVKTTGLFTKNTGIGVAANKDVRAKAFSDELVQQRLNSDGIEIVPNKHVVFIRVADYQPSREKTLEEAKQKIEKILLNQKAREFIQVDLEAVYKEASANNDWVTLAEKYNGKLENAEAILRDNRDIDAEVVEQVFLAADIDTPVKASLRNGNAVLLKLQSIKAGDLTALTSAEKEQVENEWLAINGRSEFDKILSAYKDKSTIIYHPDLQEIAEK